MIDTHYGKGLAGLLVGGLLALAGLVALFVCIGHVAADNPVSGLASGTVSMLLVGSGADVIFRAFNGTAAVSAFRATVGLVFSVVVLVAATIGAVEGALSMALAAGLIAVAAVGVWRCAKVAGLTPA